MMKKRKHGERGAAFLETAIALPVMLGALYGVTYGIRVGVSSERAEEAVRYSGVLQQQHNPYMDYSLYTVYNNLGTASNVITQQCVPPPRAFLIGGAKITDVKPPGTPDAPSYGQFWSPNSAQTGCASTRVALNTNAFSRNYLLVTTTTSVNATVDNELSLPGSGIGAASIVASQPFFKSPDMTSVMHCIAEISNVVSPSLDTTLDPNAPQITLPILIPKFGTVGVAASCNSAGGTPVPVPSTSPFNQTPVPTPAPPASPAPTSAPSSPSPGASASPGASGSPSAAPSTAPSGTGGSPKPSPSASVAASSAPTSPVTAAPATAAPTAKPTAKPTPKPTPTPQGPSGPIS